METKRQAHPRNVYEFRIDDDFYIGAIDDLAAQTGMSSIHVRRYISKPTDSREAFKIGREYPIYQLVNPHDGKVMYQGTKDELVESSGLTLGSINSNKGRYKCEPTDQFRFIPDTISAMVDKADPEPVVQEVREPRPQMDIYWSMMLRDMFKKWRV